MSASASAAFSIAQETDCSVELCKLALERAHNNRGEAVKILNRWSPRTKNNDDTTISGVVCTYYDDDVKAASIIEARCSDKLLISSKEFLSLVSEWAFEVACYEQPYISEPAKGDLEQKTNSTITFNSCRIVKGSDLSLLTTYSHKDKIGVIVETVVDKEEAFTNKLFRMFSFEIAMHIAAFNPISVRQEDIPVHVKNELIKNLEKQLIKENKALSLWPIIIDGKISKWSEQNSLINQIFIKSDSEKVEEVRKAISQKIDANIEIRQFVRFELGK